MSRRVPVESLLDAELLRDDNLSGLPEVSEVDVIRHFTRISTWNYAVDLGMYPLGSCTMKYNPKLNERVSRFDGFAAGPSLHAGRAGAGQPAAPVGPRADRSVGDHRPGGGQPRSRRPGRRVR
jgi:glycine cleavage system protein P-like pyridoxal-binding family